MAPRTRVGGAEALVRRASVLDWQANAACRGADPELFFPSAGDDVTIPKSLCHRCPVRVQCLGYALAVGERFGIWGGMTDAERHGLSRSERDRILRQAAARAA